VRLYRGEEPEFLHGSEVMMRERFPDLAYVDVPGLCRVTSVAEIESHGWSLNPGRYVGVADGNEVEFDFWQRFGELSEEFQALTVEAVEFSEQINVNASRLLADEQ